MVYYRLCRITKNVHDAISMIRLLRQFWSRISWAQQFMLTSLIIFVIGMIGVAWLIGERIEQSVVQQTAANTALYVSSVVEPNLQELTTGDQLLPEHQLELTHLLRDTSLGQQITTMKVWDTEGRVVYDTDSGNIGRVFPIDDDLATALRGWVSAEIGNTDKAENSFDSIQGTRQLETYSPLRRTGTNDIIAAVEFYQSVETLDRNIAAAQRLSWLWIGTGTAILYLALAGFIRHGSTTIQRQQRALSDQVTQLSSLLAQNEELHERIQRATRRTTTINERFLRRISADLHDGPAQDLGFALLRLDQIRPCASYAEQSPQQQAQTIQHFEAIQQSLARAIGDIRAISGGLGLPHIENLSLDETVGRAIRTHQRRTGTNVDVRMSAIEIAVPMALKITIYRLIQEALQNAYRHGGAVEQQVVVDATSSHLSLTISDQGQGFDPTVLHWDDHLGLVGMRERVESLGGQFCVTSRVGHGTSIQARFKLSNMQDTNEHFHTDLDHR